MTTDLQPLNRQNFRVPITSPVGYGINDLTTASQAVIGANAQRTKLMFFNPNALVTIWLTPANRLATTGGGSIPLYAGGGPYVVEGDSVSAGWNAIAESGAGNGLSILEFF